MNSKTKKGLLAAAAVAVLGGGGAAIAVGAAGGDDDGTDKPIAGSSLQKASDAALAHTGGGKVTGTEVGDEEGYYEVEVARDDGSQVDIHLNREFDVIDAKADDDSTEDGDSTEAED